MNKVITLLLMWLFISCGGSQEGSESKYEGITGNGGLSGVSAQSAAKKTSVTCSYDNCPKGLTILFVKNKEDEIQTCSAMALSEDTLLTSATCLKDVSYKLDTCSDSIAGKTSAGEVFTCARVVDNNTSSAKFKTDYAIIKIDSLLKSSLEETTLSLKGFSENKKYTTWSPVTMADGAIHFVWQSNCEFSKNNFSHHRGRVGNRKSIALKKCSYLKDSPGTPVFDDSGMLSGIISHQITTSFYKNVKLAIASPLSCIAVESNVKGVFEGMSVNYSQVIECGRTFRRSADYYLERSRVFISKYSSTNKVVSYYRKGKHRFFKIEHDYCFSRGKFKARVCEFNPSFNVYSEVQKLNTDKCVPVEDVLVFPDTRFGFSSFLNVVIDADDTLKTFAKFDIPRC